ncbi:hypothetical protein EV385_4644 [Krasilnikovia cinnamomea]|uniref:N-acetyltransferase domain-containing protein n=1 Tax=Krasilnikovia cinnamomea TaxID=349313 RepID=A0A4Q7ZPW1_9ACTN|nr:GNAT family N-acetyltransferase [Krasilnikovia cinnamomea]RZU52761.1 hypothetical protein EV385_4644 [Krasilnikovia cinnamomea]
MQSLSDEMVEARLGWTSTIIASWYSGSDLRQQLRDAVAVEADRLGDADFGREYRDSVGKDGPTEPLEWANRRLDLPGGGWAITGIRFRGRDINRPFVDVVAASVAPTPDGLSVVAAAVGSAYRDFAPLCLRVAVPDASGLVERLRSDRRFGPHCGVDMHVVAGLVTRLRTHPRADSYATVRLRAGDPRRLAGRVSAIYEELARREPQLAMWATPETADSLTECAGAGLLFEVLADGAPAGVVAALRDDAHAMRGFCVQELCLDASHRGRRLASGVVQRLLDELGARDGDVLWGTIHPSNAASLRNALSIGRELVGGYVWVTPAGFPGMPG